MNMKWIKQSIASRKNEKNEVADLLAGLRRIQGDPELINDIPMRMDEINSMIHVMREAAEFSLGDESFYQQHITKMLYSLQNRFDELGVLIEAILHEEWERKKKPVNVA